MGRRQAVSRQAGYSFFEVLVAMLVLGIAVMGFAGLQVRALDSTGVAHTRSQAMTIASELVERIRANPSALATYSTPGLYGVPAVILPVGDPTSWGTTCYTTNANQNGCAPAVMATFDVQEIQYLANELLPAGRVDLRNCAGVAGTPLDRCVFVSWSGTDPANCTDNATPNCVAMRVMAQ